MCRQLFVSMSDDFRFLCFFSCNDLLQTNHPENYISQDLIIKRNEKKNRSRYNKIDALKLFRPGLSLQQKLTVQLRPKCVDSNQNKWVKYVFKRTSKTRRIWRNLPFTIRSSQLFNLVEHIKVFFLKIIWQSPNATKESTLLYASLRDRRVFRDL